MASIFKNDIVLKDFFKNPRYFADLVNVILYSGLSVIEPEYLNIYDSEISTVIKNHSFIKEIELRRDIVFKYTNGNESKLIGIENQKQNDRFMLFRCMSYDSILYQRQINNLSNDNELMKVSSAVINWGEHRWQNYDNLYDFFKVQDIEKISTSNFSILVVNVLDIDYHLFKEKKNYDLIKTIQLIYKFNGKPKKLKGLVIDRDIAIIAASIVNEENEVLKKIILKQGEKVDMCESLMNFYNQGINEGINQGIDKGINLGVNKETLQKTKQIFKHFYPHEDSNILNNLTKKQLDTIFTMLLDQEPFDKIKNITKNCH
ncbi:Rpn family recombination-promoting nuclease/putative transposase [uncultured Thomasclavelia sp.]|uniref:Rpn family recombination-promoting nuclease/putative transposase n=1 Tax=uncultured Thomasclavelia sp. TaxID=3025759 RepID=UPI00262F9477|nr:Rpn family recombination-promoting nuclease/putative transposase [uncultured Thomasclavelia sp.]